MIGTIRSLFRSPDRFPALRPDTPVFVIGDVHGRADLLERLLARIGSGNRIVCVGDFIDRGDASAEVLTLLHARPDIVCLRGNHEDMLISFLLDPQEAGPRWLRNGGLQTLASFGISGAGETSGGEDLQLARDQLRDAMGEDMLGWLFGLPYWFRSGNLAVVHAGADPGAPIEDQSPDTLLWGHPEFLKTPRRDGVWVIHGHTIVDEPRIVHGRIAVDTGAYATGRLTAAHIAGGEVSFMTA